MKLLSVILFVCFTAAACNNSSETPVQDSTDISKPVSPDTAAMNITDTTHKDTIK